MDFSIIKNVMLRVIGKIRRTKEMTYSAIVDKHAPWIFVSYISSVFYHSNDEELMYSHQNNREAIVMAKVFNDMGYNVYFMQYNSKKRLPDIDCRMVFGHEPNFDRACEKYKNARKIYYGVSTYYEYRNQKIASMTAYLNKYFDCNIPLRRIIMPHKGIEYANEILLIGSSRTIETFPLEFREKITLINQSSQCPVIDEIRYAPENEYFFMAGGGNALKGVAVLITYFYKHPEKILHWIGPIEKDVKEAISNYIGGNIHVYGFISTSDQQVLSIMQRCNYIIYPSGVEGGVPGSVINAMRNGLIPLVTPWASFDGIENYGYVMKDADVESVACAVKWAEELSKTEVIELKKKCAEYARATYTIENYEEQFRNYMSKNLT